MAGSSNQKLKLLYLMKILMEQTDENHPLSVAELISELSKQGISAERKSIYNDLALLQEYGLDICKVHSKKHGYFLGSREFELPELRLLVDAVQSARFITPKKSKELIQKLERLTSINLSKNLHRQVYIEDRIKCTNEEIYYTIDKLHTAISTNMQVSFQYYEYDLNKNRWLRNGGMEYVVSPYAMTWFDDHYYLVGNLEKWNDLSHFRIDRMCNVNIMDRPRRNFEEVSRYKNSFNTADYSKKLYSMFPGDSERVKIRFAKHLVNAVLDRFGMDVSILPEDDNHFIVAAEIIPSEGFISWLFIFGNEAEVLAPLFLRNRIEEKIDSLRSIYT